MHSDDSMAMAAGDSVRFGALYGAHFRGGPYMLDLSTVGLDAAALCGTWLQVPANTGWSGSVRGGALSRIAPAK